MNRKLLAVVVLACVGLVSCGPPNGVMSEGVPQAYSDAEAQFLLKDYRGALERFEAFANGQPYSRYVPDARYWAGMCSRYLMSSVIHCGDIRVCATIALQRETPG